MGHVEALDALGAIRTAESSAGASALENKDGKDPNRDGAKDSKDAKDLKDGSKEAAAGAGVGGGLYGDRSDNILRPGDYFRLRSVKFPEFELGVTTDRIRDEYCYIGLRKIDDSTSSNNWCSSVAFCVKSNYLSTEMNKMNAMLKRTANI
jgi:hypothetical protein